MAADRAGAPPAAGGGCGCTSADAPAGTGGGCGCTSADPSEGLAAELDALSTEGRLPEAADLDALPVRDQVALMAEQDAVAVAAVRAAGDAIAAAVELVADRLAGGGRLVHVGAGTPGRLGLLDAAEAGPTFGLPDGVVVGVMAGGAGAARRAAEHGEDDRDAAVADLRAIAVAAGDAVVGISASGRTPYVLAALEHARSVGAATVAVASNPGSPAAALADVAVEVLTGPEVLSGSTRLKAGTAQKLVLHTLSTLAMVQLGRTYGDLMVDVRATNDKLRRRAERIVVEATGASPEVAAARLADAGGLAKPAVVSLLADVPVDVARQLLDRAGGRVREAVALAAAPAPSEGAR